MTGMLIPARARLALFADAGALAETQRPERRRPERGRLSPEPALDVGGRFTFAGHRGALAAPDHSRASARSVGPDSRIREQCEACARGDQHASHVLYLRVKGRRIGLYIPENLVPQIERSLENGRALQELLYEVGRRYTNAIKQERRSIR